MSDYRIGIVVEGTTDRVVIESALNKIFADRTYTLIQLQPELNAKDNACKIMFAGNVTINDNVWHFVVGVVDRDIGAKIFIDGNVYEPFDGIIDDIRIYNRALSESEVQQLYQMDNKPDNCWAIYENCNLHIAL
jgi:hypothetical protein